jgi:CRISPR-associated protein Csd1
VRERKGGGDLTPAQAYRERIERLPDAARKDPGFVAVVAALDRADWSVLQAHAAWPEIEKTNPVMTFALAEDQGELVCQRAAVRQAVEDASTSDDAPQGWCLVEGRYAAVARLHTSIKGTVDDKGKSGPGDLVSFNARAFESYGKTERQGENAPVSERAVFAYTTALNELLARESKNKTWLGEMTLAMWCDRDDPVEYDLLGLFGDDDPDARVDAIRHRVLGAQLGTQGVAPATLRVYVMALSRRKARIAVRFCFHDSFERLAPRVLQHFDDLRIVREWPSDTRTPSLKAMLKHIAVQRDEKNIPPRLAGEWLRAILEGTPYPPTLLQAVVNRCRAEQSKKDPRSGKPVPNVPYLRAAILKACINREHRRRHATAPDFQFIQEELDMSQTDPAYRLGRLFATLEKIQIDAALPAKLNATIRDRYYGAASSTPGAVFPTLLRLKNAHLNKLEPRQQTHFEKLIGEICGSLDEPVLPEFPRQLDLHAQGLFALGYYHQRQSLYGKRKADRDDGPDTDEPNAQED